MLAWSGIQQQPPALRGVSILCEKAIVRCVLYQCHDRACSNYYSLGTQPTSADEPTLFPHVLTDPEARPKTDPGVHKRLQNHGKMLSLSTAVPKAWPGASLRRHNPPEKKIPQKQKNSKAILHPYSLGCWLQGFGFGVFSRGDYLALTNFISTFIFGIMIVIGFLSD